MMEIRWAWVGSCSCAYGHFFLCRPDGFGHQEPVGDTKGVDLFSRPQGSLFATHKMCSREKRIARIKTNNPQFYINSNRIIVDVH